MPDLVPTMPGNLKDAKDSQLDCRSDHSSALVASLEKRDNAWRHATRSGALAVIYGVLVLLDQVVITVLPLQIPILASVLAYRALKSPS